MGSVLEQRTRWSERGGLIDQMSQDLEDPWTRGSDRRDQYLHEQGAVVVAFVERQPREYAVTLGRRRTREAVLAPAGPGAACCTMIGPLWCFLLLAVVSRVKLDAEEPRVSPRRRMGSYLFGHSEETRNSRRSSLKPLLVVGALVCGGLVLAVSGCDDGAALEGTKWVMTAYVADGSMQEALANPAVDATFVDGQVAGSGGINQYSGSYEVDGAKLTISPLISTMMAGEPVVMEQETAYLTALQSAGSYEIEGDTLTMKDESGATLLEFRP
jgi:heat shock protein HslJ